MSFTASVPGKAILHGEHSVVYGKAAVAISVGLRTEVNVKPLDNDTLRLRLENFDKTFEWKLSDLEAIRSHLLLKNEGDTRAPDEELLGLIRSCLDLKSEDPRYGSLISFVFLYTSISVKSGARTFLPAEISVSSALPMGAGLGSSAAYSVSLSAALLRLNGLATSSPDDKELHLISSWAYQSEVILHGKPSGIDNAICTYGGAILFRNGIMQEMCKKLPRYEVLLIDTGVSRSTKALVSRVRERTQRLPRIMEKIFDTIEQISLESWASIMDGSDEIDDKSAELLEINHHLLSAIGVSHPRLDEIVQLAKTAGFAAKLTGAGGGGCAIALLRGPQEKPAETDITENIESFKSQLTSAGFKYWQVNLGDPGVSFKVLDD